MAYNQNTLKQSDVSVSTTSITGFQNPDQRKLYDFSDRVAELMPEESPFFVYLNKVAKNPVDDPVFRFLENRTVTNWTSRNFSLAANANGGSAVSAGSSYDITVDDGSGSAISFITKGMVVAVNTVD